MNWTEDQLRDWQERQAVPRPPDLPKPKKITPRARMNSWETEYAQRLEALRHAGAISWWAFEPIKLRLANDTYYTPDFAVKVGDKLSFHEVKGFWRDDALVKFKVAAELFPFTFVALRKKKIAEGGGWKVIRQVTPADQQSLPLAVGE